MLMSAKTVMDPTLKDDPDYRAAWTACRGHNRNGAPSVVDLRECLTRALKSGWSIASVKAFAFCHCKQDRYDHVTRGAWRQSA
jgi:hypothetical protein